MKTRIITGVVGVPLLFALLAVCPGWTTVLSVAVISVVSAYEMLSAQGVRNKKQIALTLLLAVIMAAITPFVIDNSLKITEIALFASFAVMFAGFLSATLESYRGARQMTYISAFHSVIAGGVIPYFLSYLVNLRYTPHGRILVLLPFVAAFMTDAGAYFTGVFFGRHKAFLSISPNKTVEGFVGGLFIGVAGVCVYGAIIEAAFGIDASFPSLVALGLFGAAATELGDLAFSLIKRERGVKDYGNIIPGHGGMLDRFDSMVLCAPVIHWLALIFPPF
ncbi:MAG: phosphatidate cytidylyltransferase [Oscillospiraceae bacterium]|nr:phosphatidate cytidylyltransferase [Oscillospiraceae bacterium]